jgi:photosystem II stability/assembly factor-like uncharacterized protein
MNHIAIVGVLIFVMPVLPHGADAQWVQGNSGTSERLTDVAMLDSGTAIAVGRDRSILRTSDGGRNWFNVVAHISFLMPWNSVSFYGEEGIVVGDNGGVVTTTDGGKNWMWRSLPASGNCLSALAAGPGHMYVGDDSGRVFKSTDSGISWSAQKVSALSIRNLFMYRGPTVWGSPIYALTPTSLCIETQQPPPVWQESKLTQFQGLGSEAFAGEFSDGGGPGFIAGVQGDFRAAPTILRLALSDTVWRNVSIGIGQDGTFSGVAAPSADVVYACGSTGMLYKTTDGGDSWLDQTWPKNLSLNAISFADERHGVAVGDSGLILYTSQGGTTGTGGKDEDVVPAGYRLEQNFPNPFNPSTTVRYALPARARVDLAVFNPLGQHVAQLINGEVDAGYHEVRFDARGLSSGVYFYRMQAGEFVQTRSFLIQR